MPIYEYQVRDGADGCDSCRHVFEVFQKMADQPLDKCPECGAAVSRMISTHAVGASKSGFDARAKNAGFHKLVKRDKGTYEKSY
ncbi:MAG: zinc ribbon domain-containing protein [bacterium]